MATAPPHGTGAAKAARARKARAQGRHVLWLVSSVQAASSHHTSPTLGQPQQCEEQGIVGKMQSQIDSLFAQLGALQAAWETMCPKATAPAAAAAQAQGMAPSAVAMAARQEIEGMVATAIAHEKQHKEEPSQHKEGEQDERASLDAAAKESCDLAGGTADQLRRLAVGAEPWAVQEETSAATLQNLEEGKGDGELQAARRQGRLGHRGDDLAPFD